MSSPSGPSPDRSEEPEAAAWQQQAGATSAAYPPTDSGQPSGQQQYPQQQYPQQSYQQYMHESLPYGHQQYAPQAYGQQPYGPPGYRPQMYGPAGYRPPVYGPPPIEKPTGWFIVNWLFFWPTAIYSLLTHWNHIDPAAYAGDLATAQFHARAAKKHGIIALCLFGGIFVLYLVVFIVLLSTVRPGNLG